MLAARAPNAAGRYSSGLSVPTTTPQTMKPSDHYKGNKQSLPSKPCSVCGRPMSWRRKWEKNWAEVKYCSDACRRKRPAA